MVELNKKLIKSSPVKEIFINLNIENNRKYTYQTPDIYYKLDLYYTGIKRNI
jgi:hypothetical protein